MQFKPWFCITLILCILYYNTTFKRTHITSTFLQKFSLCVSFVTYCERFLKPSVHKCLYLLLEACKLTHKLLVVCVKLKPIIAITIPFKIFEGANCFMTYLIHFVVVVAICFKIWNLNLAHLPMNFSTNFFMYMLWFNCF